MRRGDLVSMAAEHGDGSAILHGGYRALEEGIWSNFHHFSQYFVIRSFQPVSCNPSNVTAGPVTSR